MESKRVCKENGIIIYAYINKIGVYIGSCLKHADLYPNISKNKSILRDGIDETREDIYWFSTPEDMEETALECNLKVLENLGVDFTFMPQLLNDEIDRKEAKEEFLDFLCESESCTGFANHALMVCKK